MDKEILDEIETTYTLNPKLQTILNDLSNDANVAYWAGEFAKSDYFENFDLAQSVFEVAVEKAQTWREYKDLAFAVGNSNGYDDKTWAKELLDIAINKADKLRDLRVIADSLCEQNDGYFDRGLAMELYRQILDESKTAYDFYCVAESICSSKLLDDKEWGAEVYEMAIAKVESSDELTYIAESIADEDNLGDEQWAEELYLAAEEYEGQEPQE